MKPSNTSPTPALSPAQRLLFWRIAAGGGSVLVKSIHPVPPPAMRRVLENAGLVVQQQVIDPLTGRQATRLDVTSRGWDWAQENLGGSFANSPAAAETLSTLLETLSGFLQQHGLQAVDLLTCKGSAARTAPSDEPDTLFDHFEDRLDTPAEMIDAGLVRQIVTLSCGRDDVAIPLRSLRRLLDIHRIELDESLRRLHRAGRIHLMPAPHAHVISEEDREAVFFDESGCPVYKVKLARQLEMVH